MSFNDFSEILLDLQGVKITKVIQEERKTLIYLEHRSRAGKCPHCGAICGTIHDYREQRIKDIPAFGKDVILVLRKRRLHCHHCQRHFQQKLDWLPKYHRMTNRLVAHILCLLTDVRSFTSVARELNLSITTIIRKFDLVSYPKPHMLPLHLQLTNLRAIQAARSTTVSSQIRLIIKSWIFLKKGMDTTSTDTFGSIQKKNETKLNSLSRICGRHTRNVLVGTFLMQPESLTNITGQDK